MSHTATVKMEFRDKEKLKETCERLGYTCQVGSHSVRLYSETVQADMSISLPGWKYPIAIKDGQIKYDNYNGSWGKITELENLQDQYSRDMVFAQAMANGYQVEEVVDDKTGEITLTLSDYS